MIFASVLEKLFGSPAKIRILRVLSAAPQPLSGRQVGELARLSHRGAIQALASLVALGVVRQRQVGKAYQYTLERNNALVEKMVLACLHAESSLLDGLKQDIKSHVGRNAISLTLYGSLARGMEQRGSDIDVFVVVPSSDMRIRLEEKAATLVPLFQQRYHALLSLHCMTLTEVKAKKKLPLLRNIVKEGVAISGTPIQELLA